jgi:hypothetical protein
MTTEAGMPRWRVIETGHKASSGCSTVADDRRAPTVQLDSGRGVCQLWQTDQLLASADRACPESMFPGPNGLRLWVFVIPPDDGVSEVPFHATATTDFGFVLQGTVSLELEDRSSVVMHPGDAFVQAATIHRWRNTTVERAVIGLVVIGTDVRSTPTPKGS